MTVWQIATCIHTILFVFQQELNYRGETISHLKETAFLYEKKVKELYDQVSEQSATITQLKEELNAALKQSPKPPTAHKETETHDSKETQGMCTSHCV